MGLGATNASAVTFLAFISLTVRSQPCAHMNIARRSLVPAGPGPTKTTTHVGTAQPRSGKSPSAFPGRRAWNGPVRLAWVPCFTPTRPPRRHDGGHGHPGAGGPPTGAGAHRERTLRNDRWWAEPTITGAVLVSFIIYSTWAAFQNADYYARPYLSPFYSPCLATVCGHARAGRQRRPPADGGRAWGPGGRYRRPSSC